MVDKNALNCNIQYNYNKSKYFVEKCLLLWYYITDGNKYANTGEKFERT